MNLKGKNSPHESPFLTTLRAKGIDADTRLLRNPFEFRDVVDRDIAEILTNGRDEVFRNLFPNQLESFLSFIQKSNYLPPHEVLLLEWLLKNRDLPLLEEKKVGELLKKIREKIFQIQDPELQIVQLAQAPKPVPALMVKPKPQELMNRTLSHTEIVCRFETLDFSIEEILDEWRTFYMDSGYAKRYTELTRRPYKIHLPPITEGAMQAFEKGFQHGKFPNVIIDDARLSDAETIKVFEKYVETKSMPDIKDTFHCTAQELREMKKKCFIEGHENGDSDDKYSEILERTFGFSGHRDKGVRYVGLATDCEDLYKDQRGYALLQRVSHVRNRTMMSLGTFVRVSAFFQNYYPSKYYQLTREEYSGSAPLEFALNNFTADGRFVVSSPYDGMLYLHMMENPLLRYVGQTPLPIFQSDTR